MKIKKQKCRHCKEYFTPDYRNVTRQNYCSRPECRRASKKASQQKWLKKPENKDYFRGPSNVMRVQEWRRSNPDYPRRKKEALQDRFPENTNKNQYDEIDLVSEIVPLPDALQDIIGLQPAVFLGLIASFTGSVLQDDIVKTVQRMQNIGTDILNDSFFNKGGHHGKKTGSLSGTYPENSQTVQLDRSPSGP